jgi:hypothetical protein
MKGFVKHNVDRSKGGSVVFQDRRTTERPADAGDASNPPETAKAPPPPAK